MGKTEPEDVTKEFQYNSSLVIEEVPGVWDFLNTWGYTQLIL